MSRTHPTAQTEGVQARVGTSGQCPPLARHEIKHVNRYDLSNEYRVSGRTRALATGNRWIASSLGLLRAVPIHNASTRPFLPIERCSVPATRTQLNSRVGPRSPPPWNSPVTNSFCLNADAL